MKKLSSRTKKKLLEEIQNDFDFSKIEKKVVTINLDEDIINYFKLLSKKTGKGYQILIRDALRFFVESKMQPKTTWESQSPK